MREWVATMVPTFIADELAAGYGVDPRVTALIELVDVYIIPVVNPTATSTPTRKAATGSGKNRRDNGTTCLGVDLNRNWDIDWNGGESTSTDTCSDVYVGTAPSPSPRAVRCGLHSRPSEHRGAHRLPQLLAGHPAELGVDQHAAPDQEAIDALRAKMSEAIQAVNGFSYPHGGGDELLYLASGVFPTGPTTRPEPSDTPIESRPTGSPGLSPRGDPPHRRGELPGHPGDDGGRGAHLRRVPGRTSRPACTGATTSSTSI